MLVLLHGVLAVEQLRQALDVEELEVLHAQRRPPRQQPRSSCAG